MRRIHLLALSSLALLVAACDPLETLSLGECGNGVVDTFDENGVTQGEDCDGLDVDGFKCRKPEESWKCSFSCKADGSCPVGYGCGTDGVCRKPTGVLDYSTYATGPSQASELLPADFDGDGVTEVVGVEPGRLRVTFTDSGAVDQVLLPAFGRPAIGRLGDLPILDADADDPVADRTDDLVLALDIGLGVMTSNGDHSFSPKTFGSISFTGLPKGPAGETITVNAVTPMAFDAVPDAAKYPGDETVALFSIKANGEDVADGVFTSFSTGGSGLLFNVADTTPRNLAGPPVTANFDLDPCLELAFPHFATKGPADRLTIYKTCVQGKNPGDFDFYQDPQTQKPLIFGEVQITGDGVDPGLTGFEIGGPAYAYDVNGDGANDLVITSVLDGTYFLHVAYNQTTGHFSSQSAPGAPADDRAGLYAQVQELPVAFGDLNQDGFLDVVTTDAVYYGQPVGEQLYFGGAVYTAKRTWDEALIVDMNADGRLDVVAATQGAADIDVLTSSGDAWNPLTFSTDGTVGVIDTGDFDGDLVNDIAYQDDVSASESRLMIAYGRTSGGPEAAAEIGSFPNIQAISTGYVDAFGSDGITDLGVIGRDTATSILSLSFFPGAGNRVLMSPYLLADLKNAVNVPIQTGVGSLRPAGNGGAASHNDVAVLAVLPPELIPGEPDAVVYEKLAKSMRVWGLFGVGEASFAGEETAICEMPFGAFFLPALREASAVVVPNQDGQALIVTPHIEPSGDANAPVNVLAGVTTAHFTGAKGCKVDSARTLAPGQLLFRPRLLDLNGKGKPEVVAILSEYKPQYLSDLLLGKQSPVDPTTGEATDDGKPASKLVVFWDGELGPGDVLNPYSPDGQPAHVADFTAGDFDGDGQPELLLVSDAGVTAYKATEAGDALVEVPGLVGMDLAGTRAALLADADGDGVKDLAIVQSSQLQIWRVLPKREVGTDPPLRDVEASGTR